MLLKDNMNRLEFPVLWSGLVSRVGASYKVNFIAPIPFGQNYSRKIGISAVTDYSISSLEVYRALGNKLRVVTGNI